MATILYCLLGTVNFIMQKYYFKTRGQEPDVECVTPCLSKNRPSEGVRIGSATCQECKCCKETDIDEWGDLTWIKCSDLSNALGQ